MKRGSKRSIPATTEQLLRELSGPSPKRRVMLIGGFRSDRDLKKFLRSLRVPAELLDHVMGTMFGYANLQVVTPAGMSFHAVELLGAPDIWWKIISEATLAAGHPIADVRDHQILIHGHENEPIPVSGCAGVLHNVYADSV